MNFKSLEDDLNKELVSTKSILSGFLFNSPGATQSPPYSDNRYIPFYYHLSKYIKPKNFLEIGFTLGLLSGAFLRNSETVESFVGIYDQYSRLGRKNIKLIYKKDFILTPDWNVIKNYKWDLVIFDKSLPYDECRKTLDIIWNQLNLEGVLVYERCLGGEDNRAFVDFCKIHDRELKILKTRYGSGIVVR